MCWLAGQEVPVELFLLGELVFRQSETALFALRGILTNTELLVPLLAAQDVLLGGTLMGPRHIRSVSSEVAFVLHCGPVELGIKLATVLREAEHILPVLTEIFRTSLLEGGFLLTHGKHVLLLTHLFVGDVASDLDGFVEDAGDGGVPALENTGNRGLASLEDFDRVDWHVSLC